MFLHIFIICVFCAIVYCSIIVYRDTKFKQKLYVFRRKLISSINEFDNLINDEEYFNKRKLLLWEFKYSQLFEMLKYNCKICKTGKHYDKLIKSFRNYFQNGESIRNKYNNEFALKELIVCRDFFDNFEAHPLSEKQREAIVHNEDNCLVIAGAGTGKTTTIAGKAAYLLNRMQIPSEQILLLTFTKNSAKEMINRIYNRINIELDVKTFHKFGLEIIAHVEGVKPSLAFYQNATIPIEKFITNTFLELANESEYLGKVTNYFLFYGETPAQFDDQFLHNYKQASKIKKSTDLITLRKEVVKSHEERLIADYLYINGINYKYEEPYKYNTATKDYSQYKPDFYLTDYDIYIEHFGIGKDGSVAHWMKSSPTKSEKEIYNNGINAKREFHNIYGTTLIETYSYENQEGNLLSNLEQKLRAYNIHFKPKEPAEVFKAIKNREQEDFTAPFISLLINFLNLVKSNDFHFEELESRAKKLRNSKRNLAFIELFWPIYMKYQEYLAEIGKIDFGDMIIKAAKYIEENKYVLPYRYILIDEFQDISLGQYKLIKGAINQNQDIKLFCVGDDWQSIYRFTGSELSLIIDFSNYFGFTKTIFLDITYRFNDSISNFSGDFIKKNPRQLQKHLKTIHTAKGKAKEIIYTDKTESAIENILSEISQANETKMEEVFILGRYNENNEQVKQIIKKFPNLKIEQLTIHKSKGMEADYVIIINLNSGTFGFPSEMRDDPVLNMALAAPEDYLYPEERRVFYVAMTRAKKKVFFIANKNNPSIFLQEVSEE